jgi:hypothetical protein
MQSILQYRRLRARAEQDVEGASNRSASDANSAEEGTGIQNEKTNIPGVQPSPEGGETLQVGFPDGDPENPQNWSRARKWWVTTAVCLIAMAVSIPASIDGPVSAQFSEHYHVGAIAGSMTTGMTDHSSAAGRRMLTMML